MKQIIASVSFDILSYTIEEYFENFEQFNNYNCKGIQLSFLLLTYNLLRLDIIFFI